MSSPAIRDGAVVIAFPADRCTSRRLGAGDRAEAIAWERAARHTGYAQITFDEAAGGAAEDVLLAYSGGELWTVRGITAPERRFGLWHRVSGVKLGEFSSVRRALEAIPLGPVQLRAIRPVPRDPVRHPARAGSGPRKR